MTSLMEMQGKSEAPSSGNTASLASSSTSASTDGNQGATLKAWRFNDQRVTRTVRQQKRKDPWVGKPRARPDQINRDQSNRSNKKRPNRSASAPAQDAPAKVVEEIPHTRALNLRRFAEVQKLPLQADLTVANEQEQVSVVIVYVHTLRVRDSADEY